MNGLVNTIALNEPRAISFVLSVVNICAPQRPRT